LGLIEVKDLDVLGASINTLMGGNAEKKRKG